MPSGVYPDTHKHEKARGLSRNKYDTKGNLRKARASRAKPPVYPINAYGGTSRPHLADNPQGHSKIRREHVIDEMTRKIIPNHDGILLEGQEIEKTYGTSTRKIRSDAGKPRGWYKQGNWNEAKRRYEREPYTEEEQIKRNKAQSTIAKGKFGPEVDSIWFMDGGGWGSEANRQSAIAETEERKTNFFQKMNYTGNRDKPKKPKKPPTGKYPKPPMPKRAPPKPPKPARPPMPKRAPPRKKVKFKLPKKKKEEPKEEPKKKGEENKGKIYKGKFKIKAKTKVI